MIMRTLAAAVLMLAAAACAKTSTDGTVSETTPVQSESAAQTTPAADAVAPAETPTADAPGTQADTFSMPKNLQTTPSGLQYTVDRPGTGPQPQAGQTVLVHYTGWLTNGEEFDSSRRGGAPLEFPIGRRRVIPGWEEGIGAMKVGERRTLVIPPSLGYGSRGMGGVIPPDATLVFKVELVGVR
jgi:peptidylprolyl isomerase